MLCSESVDRAIGPLRLAHSNFNAQWALSGLFGETYPALLVETYHYVKFSVSLMSNACCRLSSKPRLQCYLAKHMAEEAGHENWALEDLENLGVRRSDVLKSSPLTITTTLIGQQLFIIEHVHPAGIMGYVYLMESMPPRPELLQALSETYAIPSNAFKFLVGHGEADQRHMLDIKEVMDAELTSPREIEAATQSALLGLDSLSKMFKQIRLLGDG